MSPSEILEKPATGAHFLIREPRADVIYAPDASGGWKHPDFRWSMIPDDAHLNQYFIDAGFELTQVDRDWRLDLMEWCRNGWIPEPLGNGWILVLVSGVGGDPFAIFARRI